ncbi:IS1595 family transposase [Vibrio parahaemolyticus]|nr:IS1595 family transposase [Vibrio parahaemolyticus]ELA9329848.1 IS1595 family transposase [Vibrio parahaemolyticus]
MSKNLIQFQKGLSIHKFMRLYGTEEQCYQRLFNIRWPNGYICPNCHSTHHCQLQSRALYQCHSCHQQTSITSGTLLSNTKLPLTVWFLAIYLLTQAKNGVSALELSRHLGISYNASWRLKHKLMQAMKENDDKQPLDYIIQLDDAYWGGRTKGQKRGRGSPKKTPLVAAVALNEDYHPVYMRMSVVKRLEKAEITKWARKHVAPKTLAISDGLSCFDGLVKADIYHEVETKSTAEDLEELQDKYFHWVDTMLSNVKNSLHGTYHALRKKHLPRYLAEFCFRFNHRYRLEKMVSALLRAAVEAPPMPDRLLRLAESRW